MCFLLNGEEMPEPTKRVILHALGMVSWETIYMHILHGKILGTIYKKSEETPICVVQGGNRVYVDIYCNGKKVQWTGQEVLTIHTENGELTPAHELSTGSETPIVISNRTMTVIDRLAGDGFHRFIMRMADNVYVKGEFGDIIVKHRQDVWKYGHESREVAE